MRGRQLFFLVFLSILFFSDLSIADNNSTNIEKQYQGIFQEGTELYDKGNYSSAEEKFKETIAINPTGDVLFYNLAMSQYNLGKYEEAAKNLYKSIDLGYKVPPQIEMTMRPYKYREFIVRVPTGHELSFKGSTIVLNN